MKNLPIHRFNLSELPASPWKNGGGSTTELWCEPPGAGLEDFVWRVSVARIASDGPFSLFPGVDRIIALLQGGGVRLSGADGETQATLTTPLTPFVFPGELPVTATRLGGDSLDFNVMTRRGQAQANWQAFRHQSGHAQAFRAAHGLLLCVQVDPPSQADATKRWQGTSSLGGDVQSLLPGQGLMWSDASAPHEAQNPPPVWHWHSAAGSALLAVGFERLTANSNSFR
jgi:environmental stress-induced protein Ves